MNLKNFTCLIALLASLTINAQNFNMELRSTMEFPGQTLANISGFAQNGKEYALLGGQLGLIIVDVTDPDNPVQITQIPGPNNLWKEIKVYDHYAYVSTEGGPLQIVDLSPLPAADLPVAIYDGDGPIAGQIQNIHTLHIDMTKGYLYLHGATSVGVGGALVCDLNDDPFSPKYVGEYQFGGYIHDGFVDNDTLYAGHIYAGLMTMVDMTDKLNPEVLGSVQTPNEFTHNTWPTDDRQTVFTTDERDGSFLAAYDVSDPANIKELDRFQCTPGSGSIPHNVHILNDYAITAWYTDGVSVVDASNPANLVQVAWYDTYPEAAGVGFSGCWGVFPNLPSGNIIASNIPVAFGVGNGKLYVLTPTYQRACWLEGKVTNGLTGEAIGGVDVVLDSGAPQTSVLTSLLGDYKMGQVTPGSFQATFSKSGFESKTVDVVLTNGELTVLDVQLFEPGVSATQGLEVTKATLTVSPTVFSTSANIAYTLPSSTQQAELRMVNQSGQTVWRKKVDAKAGDLVFDRAIPSGNYFMALFVDGQQAKAVQLTKQ